MKPRLFFKDGEIWCEMDGTVQGTHTFSLSAHLRQLIREAMPPSSGPSSSEIAQGIREAKYGSGPRGY